MIVIKGFNGKSIKLREYLGKVDLNKTLIIDSHNVPQIFPEGANIVTLEKPVDDILDMFDEIHATSKSDRYVFYVNTYESDVLKFKDIETRHSVEIVLTVQSHADENLSKPIHV